RRAREGVDRLSWVADDAELLAPTEPLVEQELLHGRDVLELVDDEAAVLRADLLGDLAVVVQHTREEQEHVVGVDDATGRLGLLVLSEEPCDRLVVVARDLGSPRRLGSAHIVVRLDERNLGPLDLAREVAHRDTVYPETEPARRFGDRRSLVLEDLGRGTADDLGPEEAELSQGRGVEGPGLNTFDAELAQPRAHLARSTCREGHGEHRGRSERAAADPVGDAVGDRSRLARPSTREDTHRPGRGEGDLALLGVERVEDLV